ncbi:hypothetical protein fnug_283 [Pseudomonas phage fnug]|uniref:Uncharacterized protein n=3 Tax=Viruses TaxID=10239 RepID=A0A192Y7U8_9CAUD|nr:hypothetical protein KTN4_293 [Pseudomonas phage KTN4]QJB22926.1 hypothetical protein fnug_283 [Pseudomonas phage fnug]WAX23461.1 hypothetical protein [Pseudomonas phage pPA-N1803-4At.2]
MNMSTISTGILVLGGLAFGYSICNGVHSVYKELAMEIYYKKQLTKVKEKLTEYENKYVEVPSTAEVNIYIEPLLTEALNKLDRFTYGCFLAEVEQHIDFIIDNYRVVNR